jgi:hypothetical protein
MRFAGHMALWSGALKRLQKQVQSLSGRVLKRFRLLAPSSTIRNRRVTLWPEKLKRLKKPSSWSAGLDGRPVRARTADLYRVKVAL